MPTIDSPTMTAAELHQRAERAADSGGIYARDLAGDLHDGVLSLLDTGTVEALSALANAINLQLPRIEAQLPAAARVAPPWWVEELREVAAEALACKLRLVVA